jgi:hypothetical protein
VPERRVGVPRVVAGSMMQAVSAWSGQSALRYIGDGKSLNAMKRREMVAFNAFLDAK